MRRNVNRLFGPLAVFFSALCVAGCTPNYIGSANSEPCVGSQPCADESSLLPLAPPQPADFQAPVEQAYRLQAGDVLNIKFYYNNELNENMAIRPDGWIDLQLIGEVKAGGLTPKALKKTLIEKYTGIVAQPEITIVLQKFSAQRVYVGGEVVAPGPIELETPLTVVQAIVQAGGFRSGAEASNVIVLRNNGTQDPEYMALNLSDHLARKAAQDVFLRPADVVFIPQTAINSAAVFFADNIHNLIPIFNNMSLNYNYDRTRN